MSRDAQRLGRWTQSAEALHLVYFLGGIFRILVEIFAGARDPLLGLGILVREGRPQLIALRILQVRRLCCDERLRILVLTGAQRRLIPHNSI